MPYDRPDLKAQLEVEDVLEAYAEARLTPAGPVLARIRMVVMAEAAAKAAQHRVVSAPAAPRARFVLPRLHVPRRAFALGFAAVLMLGTGAAVMAAPPGSLFYNARLYVETAMLPPVHDIDARLAAYEEQFDRRIEEAEAAVVRGDESGLNAALAAFQNEVTNAVAEIGNDLDRLSRLESVLARHVAKLQELAGRLPTQVARDNALQHAIQASQRAVDKIKAQKAHENSRPTIPPGQISNPPNRP
jgi:hypothetical protein